MKFDPDWVVAPGETLAEWMKETGFPTVSAYRYGLGEGLLARIIVGSEPITPVIAERLFAMTQVSATFWLALEHNFRVGLAAGKHWIGAPK